ncbi:MAG: hypothetical protein JNJ76_04895 [Candidatus Competibacter sp.]|nr:hypothetical protein [Candidatus Competibacter sp.]
MTISTQPLLETRFRPALHGLICGFAMLPDQRIQPLSGDEMEAELTRPSAMIWLHYNARVSQARDWIARCEHLPEASRKFLVEHDERKRIEQADNCLLGVISDIRYDFDLDFDPSHIASLRFHLDRNRLITTRLQPCSTADQLRTELKQGRYFDSTAKLLIHLFESQATKLGETTEHVCGLLDDIEDQALAGRMRGQHAQLGSIRRLAVRLNHHFNPEHRMLQRLCRRPPEWFNESDNAALQDVAEEFRELVDDLVETQERAKLLQEELSARLAEQTNNNLYIVSLFTALLLPPSLIAGIFGMNVAGVPGVENGSAMAFWWVLLGMAAVSGLAILVLRLRGLL